MFEVVSIVLMQEEGAGGEREKDAVGKGVCAWYPSCVRERDFSEVHDSTEPCGIVSLNTNTDNHVLGVSETDEAEISSILIGASNSLGNTNIFAVSLLGNYII